MTQLFYNEQILLHLITNKIVSLVFEYIFPSILSFYHVFRHPLSAVISKTCKQNNGLNFSGSQQTVLNRQLRMYILASQNVRLFLFFLSLFFSYGSASTADKYNSFTLFWQDINKSLLKMSS